MKRTVLIVLLLVALVGTAGGAWWWYTRRETPADELVLFGNVDLRMAQLAFNNNERISAVLVQEGLQETFYGRLRPISEQWIPEALAVSGFSRAETLSFDDPKTVMETFAHWIAKNAKGRVLFISDNNGFDFAFVSWYFWHFTGANPFGHSSTNLGSLYKGLVKDTFQNFKHLRQTAHTHHPVDDAKGNAEALLAMRAMGLKIALGLDATKPPSGTFRKILVRRAAAASTDVLPMSPKRPKGRGRQHHVASDCLCRARARGRRR